MAAKTYYRLFFILGVISIVAVLGGFIGVYVLVWALDQYGAWLYVFLAVAFSAVVVVAYLIERVKKRREEVPPEPGIYD